MQRDDNLLPPITHNAMANTDYLLETAEGLFDSLSAAVTTPLDRRRLYAVMERVFHLCIDQQTNSVHTNFVGPFAKTDYLLKEHSAAPHIRRGTNETRIRLANIDALSDEACKQHCLHDLKHLCQFISLVYSCPVPTELSALFPADRAVSKTEVLSESMRAIVVSWDSTSVLCRIDGYGDDEPTRVFYVTAQQPALFDSPEAPAASTSAKEEPNWAYLERMFYEGAQLNLVRPRKVEGGLQAELIIFEPDYLVDISTVARCFEQYAESPYVNLVKKLQPKADSEATILGNFAGQLLDEQLHQQSARPYAESVMDFFRSNAIPLLSANVSGDFHSNAREQQHNIATAMGSSLPQLVSRYNANECIVEPSFFCEMLGLQGRMDMLQLDFRVLLEQKSGKGEYPQGDFVRPRHTEQHYVQLLLYMAVLRYAFREQYERNGRELHAFLLYSKYKESLLGLGFAPELLYRAIKVRNGLAWTELRFTQPGELRILERLTPDMLNMKQTRSPLWERFTQPQLQQLLAPIHTASQLERDYYFRFLRFIANEHVLSKLGNKTKENSGFAAKWHCSLSEKLQAGEIYDQLRLTSPDSDTVGSIDSVSFAFPDTLDHQSANFRIGDIVALYPYAANATPDIRRSIVFRGSISAITTEGITIQLRAQQTHPIVFLHHKDHLWAVEHDFMESSFTSMYRGMHAFLSAPRDRRDLLLLQRQPRVSPSRRLRGDYGSFNELSQRVKAADELFLIIGPPGTGKTSFGMLNTLLEELREPESAVLILSFTNRAVDEICSKLVESDVPFVRLGRAYNTPEPYRPYLLEQRIDQCNSLDHLRQLISETRVFVSTTTTLGSNLPLLQLKQFSLAIIDEASQILEPDLLGILSAHTPAGQGAPEGLPSIRKFVLIGDHKQLPAVVQQTAEVSRVDEPSLHAIGLHNCRSSLFERLLARYGNDPDVTYMLTRQGRMHRDIAEFVNEAFYNDRLDVVPLPHQTLTLSAADSPAADSPAHPSALIDHILATRRMAFIDVADPSAASVATETAGQDKVNRAEAGKIAAMVHAIYQRSPSTFDSLTTVGVIVPYRNQIAAVRSAIASYGVAQLSDISIDTVERYQGSQRDYIIYGFTVHRRYQLNFLTDNVFVDTDGTVVDRKLNVALTRAKLGMFLVGNASLLSCNTTFRHLITFMKNHDSFFSEA